MKRRTAVLAAVLAALAITACGNGDGVVINGTTAAEEDAATELPSEDLQAETSGQIDLDTTEGSGTKIEIITGETASSAPSEGQTAPENQEPETTKAPEPTTAAPTAAPTTAAPETTAAKVYEVKDVSKTMYATASVRVRQSYSTSSDVLGALDKGEQVKITGESANGWMRVEYKGQSGFVAKSYLTDTKPAEETKEASKPSGGTGGTTPGGTTPGGTTPGGTTSGGTTPGGTTPGGTTSGGTTPGGTTPGGRRNDFWRNDSRRNNSRRNDFWRNNSRRNNSRRNDPWRNDSRRNDSRRFLRRQRRFDSDWQCNVFGSHRCDDSDQQRQQLSVCMGKRCSGVGSRRESDDYLWNQRCRSEAGDQHYKVIDKPAAQGNYRKERCLG